MKNKPTKRSLWRRVLAFTFIGLAVLSGLFVLLIGYGIAKRGLHQDEFLAYPFAEVPLQLPRDVAAHPDYKTEWWYYTGHLRAADGKRYGFELTFFRIRTVNLWNGIVPVWWFLYPHGMVAHLALTDKDGRRFWASDALQKNSTDDVGARSDRFHVWLRDWYAKQQGQDHVLHAQDDNVGLDLHLTPQKPMVLHGRQGYHWKGIDGIASYYLSFTRMQAKGQIRLDGQTLQVDGLAWMDHEFTSFKPPKTTQGWDWFALQLENGFDVMLYQMRRNDGKRSQDSTGALIDPQGVSTPLTMPAYRIEPTAHWQSPRTGARYPAGWTLRLPTVPAQLTVTPSIADQELALGHSNVTYWEGACEVSGTWAGAPVRGMAYVELTGYLEPVAGRF